MTRSASPNGAVEFSYDFPVAGPSHLRLPTPTRTHHTRAHTQPRTRSPTRPRWEADEDDSVDDDEIDYDAFGYPRVAHRAATQPMPTRNQWRAPSPPLYPYADAYTYASYTSNPYTYPAPLLLAPAPSGSGSSYESNNSVLSSCARSCHSQKEKSHAKIRKPRRSVDSDSAPAPSSTSYFTSSPASSPYFSSFSDEDSEDDDDAPSDDEHEQEQEKENAPAPAPATDLVSAGSGTR
ncbi:hypothetical protein B0H19DRAFT_1180468 [Mycena capillaripes]|nr:hypothetical protein B0H19DRAFT_1180468 [Mycena capillaripes]